MINMVADVGEGRRDYILNHGALAAIPNRGNDRRSNVPCFREDLAAGVLDAYRGDWVVYHKGVHCGECLDGKELYTVAQQYYGSSNLAVFRVPQKTESVDDVLREALGQF